MHLGCYIKETDDVNAANFNNTMKLHFQLFSMISGMSFAVPQHYKAIQNQQITTLKFKNQLEVTGNKIKIFIKNYKKLFIVLNEEGTVVSWESTDFNSQDKIEPVFNDGKFKLKNNQITYIQTDTRCSFSNVYEQCFTRVSIKLDLFHATQ